MLSMFSFVQNTPLYPLSRGEPNSQAINQSSPLFRGDPDRERGEDN